MLKGRKNYILISLLSGLAILLVVAGVWLFGGTTKASAAEDLKTITQASASPGLLNEGYLNHGGPDFLGREGVIDYPQLLADALGITVEDLEAAYETARTAAIEQAVEEGLITREKADEMLVWGGFGRPNFGVQGFGRARKGEAAKAIDEQALLAEALGITVADLEAAREAANQAALEKAVAEGLITQEQADEMLKRKTLQSYLERDALLAKALGMTVDDLDAAYAEGKTLSDLMAEQGLDAATVREKLVEAHAEALVQAVADGVITQEEADEMQDAPFGGRGGRRPGRGMMRDGKMPGRPGGSDFRDRRPAPDGGPEDTDGVDWRVPNSAPAITGDGA